MNERSCVGWEVLICGREKLHNVARNEGGTVLPSDFEVRRRLIFGSKPGASCTVFRLENRLSIEELRNCENECEEQIMTF